MTFPLPEPFVGGPMADPLKTDDPRRFAKQLEDRFDQVQQNFDKLTLAFPLDASLLLAGAVQSDNAGANLTLTNVEQPVPGVSITIPSNGTYLFLAVFYFEVTVAGAGVCVGIVSRGASNLAGLALYQPSSTGSQTTPQFNVAAASKGDVVALRAYKSSGGTAQATGGHTRLLVFGPIGPVS